MDSLPENENRVTKCHSLLKFQIGSLQYITMFYTTKLIFCVCIMPDYVHHSGILGARFKIAVDILRMCITCSVCIRMCLSGLQNCRCVLNGIYHIWTWRALRNENSHGCHIVLNQSVQNWPLRRAFRNEGIQRVQLMDTLGLNNPLRRDIDWWRNLHLVQMDSNITLQSCHSRG